jgi:mannitol-1-phosphate/altronate dehydrogenase
MADPPFARYAASLMDDEITPLLPDVGIDLTAYSACLRERFANPRLADPLARLCRDGTTKVVRHVLPSIREARMRGRPSPLLTLAVAAWCRCLRGVDERGRRLTTAGEDDRVRSMVRQDGGGGARCLLAHEPTFGSLASCPEFVADVERDVQELELDGVAAVLERRTRSLRRLADRRPGRALEVAALGGAVR